MFRGATVALMILVNNPGSWAHIYSSLEHAPWHGLTPTDLVFPFFLFAVGNAMAFVMPRLEAAGPAIFWRKVIKRTLLIFGIGLFLNWWPFLRWQGDALAFSAGGEQPGLRLWAIGAEGDLKPIATTPARQLRWSLDWQQLATYSSIYIRAGQQLKAPTHNQPAS